MINLDIKNKICNIKKSIKKKRHIIIYNFFSSKNAMYLFKGNVSSCADDVVDE